MINIKRFKHTCWSQKNMKNRLFISRAIEQKTIYFTKKKALGSWRPLAQYCKKNS